MEGSLGIVLPGCSVGSCKVLCDAALQLWEGRCAAEPAITSQGRTIITGCVSRVMEPEAPVALSAIFSLTYLEMLPWVVSGATGGQQY